MISSYPMRQSLLMICLLIAAACTNLKYQPEYQAELNQPGKDVVWWPTAQVLVNKMLDMAKVTPEDYVIDLGSGDGRLVITASKRGARALGIEYNPDLVALSKLNAVREGVGERTQFVHGDLFKSDFSEATVITMFLSEAINHKLRPRILNLKPGTRIVSNSFSMADWAPDETATIEEGERCSTYCKALLWIVPAKVEGTWRLPQGELTLKQSFQMLSGTFKSGANTVPITNGRLRGDSINFSVGDANYTGRVNGSTIQGTVESGGSTAPWMATQAQNTFRAPSEKQNILGLLIQAEVMT